MSSEEERTQMLERPRWLEVERRRVLEGQSTRGLDSSSYRAVSRPVRQRMVDQMIDEGPAAEATTLFDPALLRQSQGFPAMSGQPALPLLDEHRALPLDLGHLPHTSREELEAFEIVSALLPMEMAMEELEEALSERLTQLVGQSHLVRWVGLGVVEDRDLWAVRSLGALTWARVLPGSHRVFAGVQLPLMQAWVRALMGTKVAVGDDFEYGLVNYLLAELWGTFTHRVAWPPLSWSVNPMHEEMMGAMLRVEASPLMELVFSVTLEGVCSAVHLWLSARGLRQIREEVGQMAAKRLAFDEGGWWKDLVMRRPLYAGSAMLSGWDLSRLEVGDILLLERHGVDIEEASESLSEDGARWMVGSAHSLRGTLIDGGGEWSFKMVREGRDGEAGEVEMSGLEEGNEQGLAAVAIEEAMVQVDVRIGLVELDLGSLARVRPGQVIDCGEPVGGAVDLVVSGVVVGRGELVTVDGRLGVRVLRMQKGLDDA